MFSLLFSCCLFFLNFFLFIIIKNFSYPSSTLSSFLHSFIYLFTLSVIPSILSFCLSSFWLLLLSYLFLSSVYLYFQPFLPSPLPSLIQTVSYLFHPSFLSPSSFSAAPNLSYLFLTSVYLYFHPSHSPLSPSFSLPPSRPLPRSHQQSPHTSSSGSQMHVCQSGRRPGCV